MTPVLDWLDRLTVYGWLDLGGHALVVTLLAGVLWDLERLLRRMDRQLIRKPVPRPRTAPPTTPIPAQRTETMPTVGRHRPRTGATATRHDSGIAYADADD
jgi:hypothetical protein